jgi:hypothetical protein
MILACHEEVNESATKHKINEPEDLGSSQEVA